MTVNYVAVSFGVHRTTIWRLAQRFRITGTVKNRTISVDQNFSLLEKNVTSRSQQVVTASYQQQGLSTEYGEQLESVYPGKQSVITLKLVVSNQEDHIKIWMSTTKDSDTHGKISTCAETAGKYLFRMNIDSH